MLTATRKYIFDSAHHIPGFPEDHRCRRMHGHTYVLHVTWSIDRSNVVPFEDIDPLIRSIIDLVDHRVWNDVVPVGTLEEFGPWIWNRLLQLLEIHGTNLVALRLCEGETSEISIDGGGP
jgi:6-pyruvoyltetrahydropterin/6-carboxytetrahydropterin synthase